MRLGGALRYVGVLHLVALVTGASHVSDPKTRKQTPLLGTYYGQWSQLEAIIPGENTH